METVFPTSPTDFFGVSSRDDRPTLSTFALFETGPGSNPPLVWTEDVSLLE